MLAPENQAWDLAVKPFSLPPRTRLLLADIHAGSNTPLLVSKVLKWRSENSAAGAFCNQSDGLLSPLAYRIRDLPQHTPSGLLLTNVIPR